MGWKVYPGFDETEDIDNYGEISFGGIVGESQISEGWVIIV